jgi:hypothetical protein
MDLGVNRWYMGLRAIGYRGRGYKVYASAQVSIQ